MADEIEQLVFSTSPTVEFGSNTFHNVPTILQYEDTPLVEVVQVQAAGFSTQFQIFAADGAYLAKAVGSRLFLTEDGRKSNLVLRHPSLLTACELNGKTLFEIRRKGAASLSTEAELFTPDGRFVRAKNNGAPTGLFEADGSSLRVGGVVMSGNVFVGLRIGVWVRSTGSVAIGVS